MNIRPLQKTDLPQLANLYEQFWNEKSHMDRMDQQFDRIQTEDHHILLVIEEDGIITGSVMGIVCEELYGDCRPFLVVENMIVDRQQREKGIGSLLLSELERQAKKRNCTQMILVTEEDRIDACGFYEAYGFQKKNRGFKKKLIGSEQ